MFDYSIVWLWADKSLIEDVGNEKEMKYDVQTNKISFWIDYEIIRKSYFLS